MSPVGRVLDLLQPLAGFYAAEGRALPRVDPLSPADVPQPHRGLLVHERDMTSTLESYFGQQVELRVLQQHERDGLLAREVVLVGIQDGTAVEFGAIRIHLEQFDEGSRGRVVAGRLPLGRILAEDGIEYRSSPRLYFRFRGDALTARAFGASGAPALYGRHNVLSTPAGQPLAEAVEILPPLETEPDGAAGADDPKETP